ncbi:peptidylprolyl isomerase [Desulfuromonas carbonis]
MKQAKQGDRVRINYVGRLSDGSIVDSSEDTCEDEGCGCDSGPLEFVIGDEEVIPGLEQALVGMQAGEKKSVNIPCDLGYGPRDEELVIVVPRSDLPEELDPAVGDVLEVTDDDEGDFAVTVTAVTPESVTLDANHPLAGEDLVFEVELVEIV